MSKSAILWTVARQAPLSMRILQARILEWVAMPSSRGCSQFKEWTRISSLLHWQVGSLPLASPGKPFKCVGFIVFWISDLESELVFEGHLDDFVPNVPPQSLQWVGIHSLLKYEKWQETHFLTRLFIHLWFGLITIAPKSPLSTETLPTSLWLLTH